MNLSDVDRADFGRAQTVEVAAPAEAVWALVTDVSRTPEWSPVVAESWYEDGDGPRPGAVVVGRNVTPTREWTTRSRVVEADPPRSFAWVVGEDVVRWGYEIERTGSGCRLTETWQVLDTGFAFFERTYGDDAGAQLEERREAAVSGIPATLEAIRAIAEREAG